MVTIMTDWGSGDSAGLHLLHVSCQRPGMPACGGVCWRSHQQGSAARRTTTRPGTRTAPWACAAAAPPQCPPASPICRDPRSAPRLPLQGVNSITAWRLPCARGSRVLWVTACRAALSKCGALQGATHLRSGGTALQHALPRCRC